MEGGEGGGVKKERRRTEVQIRYGRGGRLLVVGLDSRSLEEK